MFNVNIISLPGTDLWVMAIGENASDHVRLRPHVKYIANMHGNEVGVYYNRQVI